MTPDAKRQKQQDRERARKQRWVKIAAGAVVMIAALVFTVGSFTTDRPSANAGASTSEGFRRITVEELKTLCDRDEVTLIDVRDAGAFLQAHIPGALQIPLARIDGETPYLPKGKLIVTYCTCPAEESSGQAAQILAYRGINAAALTGGLEAWQRRGYPMAAGMPAGR